MKNRKSHLNQIEDFGRPIKNSKKEKYRLEDGQYRITLSDVWPAGEINSGDRFCRFLINTLRKGIRCLTTTSIIEVKNFDKTVKSIKDSAENIQTATEFYRLINKIKEWQESKLNLVFKNYRALFFYLNKPTKELLEDMEASQFEVSSLKNNENLTNNRGSENNLEKSKKKFRLGYSGNPGIRKGPEYIELNRNILEDDILSKFGYCGQFGNYLNQSDRSRILNSFYYANCDLSFALGCSPADLSLKKNNIPLGVSFAARGSGRANGHFEPDDYVINLTKRTLLEKNCGVYAHEFGHAFDNWLCYKLLGQQGFYSETPMFQLKELKEFKAIINFLLDFTKKFNQDAIIIDTLEGRRKPYWSSMKEKFARVFNSSISEILRINGRQNDFLAFNFNDEIRFLDGSVSANPLGNDLSIITEMFLKLFEKLKSMGLFDPLNEKELYIKNNANITNSFSRLEETQLRFI